MHSSLSDGTHIVLCLCAGVQANLAFSSIQLPGTPAAAAAAAAGPLLGREATTAPSALRVLFLGASQVQNSCRQPQAGEGHVLVVTCGGAAGLTAAAAEAEQRLWVAGVWKGPQAQQVKRT
jgi:hypothetical protein